MEWISWSITILVASGIGVVIPRDRRPGSNTAAATASWLGALGCLAASGLGLWGSGLCLLLRQYESSRLRWSVPFGSLNMGLDSLSALFLIPVFLVGGLAALSSLRRLPGDYAANRPREHWLFINLTLAGAALVPVARNAVLFLFAWELMTVASFLLVENDQRRGGARSGGWVYLTAGHLGGACLFAMFALMGMASGSLDFAALKATGGVLTAAFLLAWAGFGGKMGLSPFQAWYPESYPQAPAHVGAILSGVIGNLGLYGLLRFLMLTGKGEAPPAWWGLLLLASGLAAALLGAARAMTAKDLSRLLAWSSVDNFGLMAAGAGVGLIGASTGNPPAALLGFTAAVFHMLNHSVSKGLLFLAAGSVYARAGTRMLDRMGGLLKRLPLTGLLFLLGALGAAAIPPLNGFASEVLLLMSAYEGAVGAETGSLASIALMTAVAVVALVGGLATAAYAKAFGFVFLGNPRGGGAASNAPERRKLLLPHLILAACAVFIAVLSFRVGEFIRPTAETLARLWRAGPAAPGMEVWRADGIDNPLRAAMLGAWLFVGCLALAYLIRFLLMRGKAPRSGPTWDCGYARPDARMQYNASSFVRPLGENFRELASLEDDEAPPWGLFPVGGSFASSLPGVERAWGFSQVFAAASRLAARIRRLQTGKVQAYLFYMAVTLVILLLWKL